MEMELRQENRVEVKRRSLGANLGRDPISQWSTQQWIVTLAVFVACFPIVRCGSIYLSPNGQVPLGWNGNCAASTCSIYSPCRPPAVLQNDEGEGCVVTILNGSYSSFPIDIAGEGRTLTINFVGGAVSNLHLATPTRVPFNIILNGSSSLLTASSFKLEVRSSISLRSMIATWKSTFKLSALEYFVNACSFQFASGLSLSLPTSNSFTYVEITNTEALDSPITVLGAYALIANSTLRAQNDARPIAFSASFSHQVTFRDSSLEYLPGEAVIRLGGSPCRVEFEGTHVLPFRPAFLPTPSPLFNSSMSPQFVAANSHFTSVLIYNATQGSIEPTPGRNASIENCTFIDTALTLMIPTAISWRNVTFNQHETTKNVVIDLVTLSPPEDANHVMDHVAFSNTKPSPNNTRSQLIFQSNHDVFITSGDRGDEGDNQGLNLTRIPPTLSVSDLYLEFIDQTYHLYIHNIEVTHAIQGNSQGRGGVGSTLHAPFGSIWTFHSINIGLVPIQFEPRTSLIYVPSVPHKGISVAGSPFSIPMPPRLFLYWPPDIDPPPRNTSFPISRIGWPQQTGSAVGISCLAQYCHATASFDADLILSFSYDIVIPPPSLCPPVIPPGFLCHESNGTLYTPGDLVDDTIIIPPRSGDVLVAGNLTLHSSIVFIGTGSTLDANGCVNIEGEVVLDLAAQQHVTEGSIVLISQSSNCPNSLSSLPLSIRNFDSKHGCKRVLAQVDKKAPPNMYVIQFKLDHSRCNTKWAIIGAVVGSVALILIVLGAVFTFHKGARDCLHLPCTRAGKQPALIGTS